MGSLGRSGQRRETLLLAEVLDLTTEEVGDKEAGLNLDLHVEEAGETHLDLHSRVAPHPRGLLFRVGLHLKDLDLMTERMRADSRRDGKGGGKGQGDGKDATT